MKMGDKSSMKKGEKEEKGKGKQINPKDEKPKDSKFIPKKLWRR